jgi:hypothetical protein
MSTQIRTLFVSISPHGLFIPEKETGRWLGNLAMPYYFFRSALEGLGNWRTGSTGRQLSILKCLAGGCKGLSAGVLQLSVIKVFTRDGSWISSGVDFYPSHSLPPVANCLNPFTHIRKLFTLQVYHQRNHFLFEGICIYVHYSS